MTSTALGILVGVVVGALCWSAAGKGFDVDALRRTNYRGSEVQTSVGVLIPVAVAMVAAMVAVVVAADQVILNWDRLTGATLVASFGFGLLGLFDDVAGAGRSGGFGGHVSALRRGVVTSGMVKLVGGAAIGLLTVSAMQRGNGALLGLLRDGAIVALAANLGNLFDRAPGRATKVTALGFAVLGVVAAEPMLFMPAVAVGAGLGLLVPDLRERVMLGDAGANVLGAMCGIAALVAFDGSVARWMLLLGVLGLNVASEVVSFGRVIDAVAPLRWFDRLGSLRPAR